MSEASPPNDLSELGEVALEDGFRRVSRAPEPLALARLRERLLDVTVLGSDSLREGLEGFDSWRALGVLCGTEWAAGTRRSSLAGRRVLQRRLRALGAKPTSPSTASALPLGSPVHLRGIIRPLSPSRLKAHMSYIWSHGTISTDNVRLTVERGHDFFLAPELPEDPRVESVCVIAARGYLVNADALVAGDRVSVFGFTDRVADPRRSVVQSFDEGALVLALRAGDDSPLLIRRAPPR